MGLLPKRYGHDLLGILVREPAPRCRDCSTIGYTQAENACLSKWLCSKIDRIQIPAELVSDLSFLLEHRDALYLERMHDYLDDRRARPPILDAEFWLLDLPLEDSQRARDHLSQNRAEWALCVGVKKIVAFAENLALHDNADGRARTAYDVCSVPSRDKCTRFICNSACDELPVLIESWVGVRGLTMQLPKVLHYLGTECVQRKRFKNVDPEKFALNLELEMVHALACALYVDYRHGQVWLMEYSAVLLLEKKLAGSRNRDPRGRHDRDRRTCASVPSCSCSPWRARVRAS